MASTPTELVCGIVVLHGPISGKDITARCSEAGFGNEMSTRAVIFNAKRKDIIRKDVAGLWTLSPTE